MRDEDAGDAEGDHEEGADEEDELPAEVVGDGAESQGIQSKLKVYLTIKGSNTEQRLSLGIEGRN